MEGAKLFYGLLNGLTKRIFFQETEFDDETLKTQLYPDLSDEDFEILLNKTQNLLTKAAYEDMDLQHFTDFVASLDFTDEQKTLLAKFWRNQKAKIHDSLVSKSFWESSLSSVNWRIDVKTKSKNSNDLSEPVAIVELEMKKSKENLESVIFEMNADSIKDLVTQIETIQKAISA